MRASRQIIVPLLLLSLSACNKKVAVECSAGSAQEPVVSIVREQLEKQVAKLGRGPDGNGQISLSKIRALIGQLAITIDDIRTSKEDPNSTKRFCTGTLSITVPAEAVADAETTRQTAQLNTVDQLADQSDVNRSANKFTTDLEFNVQPTDDGTKVFAQTESGKNMFDFASEILASSLLKSTVIDANRKAQQDQQQQLAAQNAALAEQKAANLESAKADDQLAIQAINSVWQALSPATRANALPLQRAWNRKKNADCKVEAASASLDPSEQQVAQMQCDARMNRERMSELNQYRDAENASAEM